MSTQKLNWETEEVIDWLNGNSGDEWVYRHCANMSADDLKEFVLSEQAPAGLYESFKQPPVSSFNDVDWEAVEEYLREE